MLGRPHAVTFLAALAAAAVALTACGGSSSAAATKSTPTPSSGTAATSADFAKIQQCLQAAGIASPGAPGGLPSGLPSGNPSTGRFSPPPGANPAQFSDPKVQAALKACGISLPRGRPTP
jgi:hypothetical protein